MQFNVLFAKSLLARISPQGLVCFVCVAMPAFAVVFDLHVAGTIHLSDQLLVVVKHDRLQHSPLSFSLGCLHRCCTVFTAVCARWLYTKGGV